MLLLMHREASDINEASQSQFETVTVRLSRWGSEMGAKTWSYLTMVWIDLYNIIPSMQLVKEPMQMKGSK